MSEKESETSSCLDGALRVSVHHRQLLGQVSKNLADQKQDLTDAIDSSIELLSSLGYEVPQNQPGLPGKATPQSSLPLKPWEEILAEAQKSTPEYVDFDQLLTPEEIEAVLAQYASIGNELNWFASLDRYDFALAIASGVVAGVLDVLLVSVPAHPGFLGSAPAEGGWLSNVLKEATGRLLPEEKVKALEKAYGVCFDPSTNSKLGEAVPGLGPRTHRFQSLGHDPLLGFIFGVRDMLYGEFTAIGKDGSLVIQKVADPFQAGEQLFVRIAEAMKTQFGHLASDFATPAGLPAPLMPLLSFLQFGKIGEREYTIGEVARQMYRSGYDFRHFLAGSLPVLVAEVIVRIGFFVKAIRKGKTLKEAVPSASSISLRRQLLIAHSAALLVNAGKVSVTQNPLAISWAQVLAFLRYLLPEVAFLLHGQEGTRSRMVEEKILQDYQSIDQQLDRLREMSITLTV